MSYVLQLKCHTYINDYLLKSGFSPTLIWLKLQYRVTEHSPQHSTNARHLPSITEAKEPLLPEISSPTLESVEDSQSNMTHCISDEGVTTDNRKVFIFFMKSYFETRSPATVHLLKFAIFVLITGKQAYRYWYSSVLNNRLLYGNEKSS